MGEEDDAVYEELMIALDGSDVAARAAAFAAHLPSRCYRIVHVEPPFQRLAPGPLNEFRGNWQEIVASDVSAELAPQVEGMFTNGPPGSDPPDVILDARFGDIVEELIATSTSTDLVVMTTRGRGVAGRALFGSVADQVARRGVRPTLLLRPDHPTDRPVRVVVPLDGTPLADSALPAAIQFAETLDIPLMLVQVIASECDDLDHPLLDSGAIVRGRGDAVAASIDRATEDLTNHTRNLSERGLETRYRVILGETEPALTAFVSTGDVIVMASRALSGIPRLLLGSVAEHLVRYAPAPVMIVRDEPQASSGKPTDQRSQLIGH